MADATARALVAADAQGLASHGVSRVPQYATHLAQRARRRRCGRRGGAREGRRGARRRRRRASRFLPARSRSSEAIARARESGVAFAGVTNSHHFGVAAYHLEPVAAAGMVGLAFGNSPAAMPAAGGKRPIFGTNPIAAVFPRRDGAAARDRPVALGGRARQADGRGEGRQADPARLGARRGRQSDDRPEGARSRDRCCRWAAAKGAMLALVVELLVLRADRRGNGVRSRHVLRRRGQPPADRTGVPRRRPRRARRPRGAIDERIETLVKTMLLDDGGAAAGRAPRRARREGCA